MSARTCWAVFFALFCLTAFGAACGDDDDNDDSTAGDDDNDDNDNDNDDNDAGDDDDNCVGEGSGYAIEPDHLECCAGLDSVGCDTVDEETGECAACDGFTYCTNCGDGICGPEENKCRCPADCDTGDDDDTTPESPDYPNDDLLHVNDLQGLGTHNSYHIEPSLLIWPDYNYTHKPLDEQTEIGVRQFELDLHWIPSQGLRVFHAPIIDPLSTCEVFTDCLAALKEWSDGHPGHHPILVFLEPKNDLNISDIAAHAEDVEADILSVWPRDRILTPDDVRGEYDTLREAILTAGWPTLGATRNKIIFHAHSLDEFLANYHALYPELEGALMFTDSTPDDSYAGIMPLNDPIGDEAAIRDAVTQGFLVRTMAGDCCDEPEQNDYTRFEAALASGAHFISTDFPSPDNEYEYFVEIPAGNPSRCNPLTAPEFCTAADIENLPE